LRLDKTLPCATSPPPPKNELEMLNLLSLHVRMQKASYTLRDGIQVQSSTPAVCNCVHQVILQCTVNTIQGTSLAANL
jgi:hypothetical protein